VNVADGVIQFLAERGVEDVFMVSGGGIMYLTDALGRAGTPRYWCNHHEQACAIAAEGYARIKGTPGVCLVTSGPGATNALSGIAGAWVDSIPVIVISGQVRRELIADYSRWRQLGPQEIDIIDMARPVTKLALEIASADEVPQALELAWETATTGRPGPVWLSIPLDVQGADYHADGGSSERVAHVAPAVVESRTQRQNEEAWRDVLARLRAAKRPLIVCGNGIHLARAEDQFSQFVERLGIPVVATIGAMDLLGEVNPHFVGRFGPTGQRRANFALQNADLLLCMATGMSVAAIGFDSAGFAPGDVALAMDIGDFMQELIARLGPEETFDHESWSAICQGWKARYPIVTDEYLEDREHVSSYYLANALSQVLTSEDVILTGNSLDAHSVFHSFAVTKGQRLVTNVNFGAMGWDLPALVGACAARREHRVVLVTGDGSIEFNSQELLTIGARGLNAVIFVLNNGGYQSIRSTQQRFAEGRLVGSDESSGVSNPSFASLAEAYGLRYCKLETNEQVDAQLAEVVGPDGPTLCEVSVGYWQERIPRVVSKRLPDGTLQSGALHDQYPFRPESEIAANMSVSAASGDSAE